MPWEGKKKKNKEKKSVQVSFPTKKKISARVTQHEKKKQNQTKSIKINQQAQTGVAKSLSFIRRVAAADRATFFESPQQQQHKHVLNIASANF